MTRAEYEKKYGVSPALNTEPSAPKMTRAEYEVKYGLSPDAKIGTGNAALDMNPVFKQMGTNANNKNPLTFGNPAETVRTAGDEALSAIEGTGRFAGKGAVERGLAAGSSAAIAVPTVAANLVPGGTAALDVIGKGFGAAIGFAGSVPQKLADVAQKIGIMSPEQRKQYDQRNEDFANSPEGVAIESAAAIANYSSNIAGVITGGVGTARLFQKAIDTGIPKMRQQIAEAQAKPPTPSETLSRESSAAGLVAEQADEIGAIEARYAKGRKANLYSKDAGADSRARIAQSNVLKHSVNEDGLIQTKLPGGPVEQYKAMTIKPAEGVVRANLVREGNKVNLRDVQASLDSQIRSSGLQGADLVNALNGVKKEIAGLRLKADQNGYVDVALLHDAKINTTNNIDFFTPRETRTYRTALASAYKKLVEDNTYSFDVRAINAELAKYMEDIARLERLDGARVQGGRLGKYAAQISGNVIGGAFGSLFGAPGAAVGALLGGEVSGLIKGKGMAATFKNTGTTAPTNPILDKAVEQGRSPRLMLPAASSGLRSQVSSPKTINLPARSQSTVDAQEKSLGSRNTRYATPAASSKKVITAQPSTSSKKGKPSGRTTSPTTPSKPSTAGSISTGSAATGKEGVSARKADTSVPFDEAKGIKLYHGTSDTTAVSEAIVNGTLRSTKEGNLGEGFYFTTTPDSAKTFVTGKGGVIEFDSKGLKLKTLDDDERLAFADGSQQSQTVKAQKYEQQGYDGIIARNWGVIFPKSLPKLASKSSPSIPKELEPLAKEARKYGSAEEFSKNVGAIKEDYDWKYLDEMQADKDAGRGYSHSDYSALSNLAKKYRGNEPGRTFYRAGSLSKTSTGEKHTEIYLTDNEGLAQQYANSDGVKVGEYKLVVQNPLDATDAQFLEKTLGPTYRELPNSQTLKQKLIKYAKDNGYDSVTFPDSGPDGEGFAGNSTVVWNKELIKTEKQLTDFYNKVKGLSPAKKGGARSNL